MVIDMKLRLITETIDDMIQAISQQSGIPPAQVKATAAAPSQKYWKWTLNQWHKGNLDPTSKDTIKSLQELFDQFEVLAKQGTKTDINAYKTVEDLKAYIALAHQRQITKYGDGAKVIHQHDPFIIYAVKDAEALKLIGEGSKWCTRGSFPNCAADDYIYRHGYLIVITKAHEPYIQFTPDLKEINWDSNAAVPKSTLFEILSDLGTSVSDLIEKSTDTPSITAGASRDAITLYNLTKCTEAGTYNPQLEEPLAVFLRRAFNNVISSEHYGILFDELQAIFRNHNSRATTGSALTRIDSYATRRLIVRVLSNGKAMAEDVGRALSNIIDMVCEFLSIRPKPSTGSIRDTRPYHSMREIILELFNASKDYRGGLSKLAGAYDTNVGRFVETEAERADIRNIAAQNIEGILELKSADGARVPEGENYLLSKVLSDIEENKQMLQVDEIPYFTQNFDNLFDYYETITDVSYFDPNRLELLRTKNYNVFRWPEYEQILLAYPVYSPSYEAYKSKFTTLLNSLTSYMVMNEITTADLPQAQVTIYRYLRDLSRLYYEDRAQFISQDRNDTGIIGALSTYLGLAATENDANQIIALFNLYPQVVNDRVLNKFINSI